MVMTRMTVLGFYYLAYESIRSSMQNSLNTLQKLNRQLMNWLQATRQAFIVRWNTWNLSGARKRQVLVLDEKVLEELIRTKDEFIVYLQDEIAQLRAVDEPKRIKVETEYKSSRAYKSVHMRVRDQVLVNKAKHIPVPAEIEEEQYDKVIVND